MDQIWVLLLRGVNVGGNNHLPMAEFRALLTGLGLRDVQTYIQSGNAVFSSDVAVDDLTLRIRAAITARFGLSPPVFLLSAAQIQAALTDHPFVAAAPDRVHVVFLAQTPPRLDEAAMRVLAATGDAWQIAPGRFTLYTPDGVGKSKLMAGLHKFLPGEVTARNLRTVAALAQLAGGTV